MDGSAPRTSGAVVVIWGRDAVGISNAGSVTAAVLWSAWAVTALRRKRVAATNAQADRRVAPNARVIRGPCSGFRGRGRPSTGQFLARVRRGGQIFHGPLRFVTDFLIFWG